MNAVLESVCMCCIASDWTAATSVSSSSLPTLLAGSETATPPYTRWRLRPAVADGIAAASSARNVSSISDVYSSYTCSAAVSPVSSTPVTLGLVAGRPAMSPA
jgi:hypothetical protein